MRLYTNHKGSWVGTQADARKEFGKDWSEVDVPTDKPSLLEFLNNKSVGGTVGNIPEQIKKAGLDVRTAELAKHERKFHPQSCSANRDVRAAAELNRYDISDIVLNCPRQYLGGALAAIVTRIYDMEDSV